MLKRKRILPLKKYNPDVSLEVIKNKKCIIVTFEGYLRAEDTQKAVARTIKFLEEHPDEKLVLVWNCIGMTDYETESRKILQKAGADYKDYMEKAYGIVRSPIIQAAGEIISFFTPVKIKIVNSYEKMVEDL